MKFSWASDQYLHASALLSRMLYSSFLLLLFHFHTELHPFLFPGNKRGRLKTLTQCVEWSAIGLRLFWKYDSWSQNYSHWTFYLAAIVCDRHNAVSLGVLLWSFHYQCCCFKVRLFHCVLSTGWSLSIRSKKSINGLFNRPCNWACVK